MKVSDDDCRQPPPFMSYFPHGFMFSGVAALLSVIGCVGDGKNAPLLVIVVLAGFPWDILGIPLLMLLEILLRQLSNRKNA